MKKLISALLLIASMTTQAGIIKNKKNQDSIQLDLDKDRLTVVVVQDTLGEKRSIEIQLKDWDFQSESLYYIFSDETPFSAPYNSTKQLLNKDNQVPTELAVTFFPLAVAFDTILLPISLPVNLFSPYSFRKFKKDMKVIREVLESNKTKKVSKAQFKRIDNIVNFFFP
ncbi:MAG: hypothetical protein ACOVP4_09225 [Bacteriovoracaceae bacterium]